MFVADQTAAEVAHRLLFRALVEIRAQGHASGDKLVYHLADLFHQAALDLDGAAAGRISYEEVLRRLEERADEKGCRRWLDAASGAVAGAMSPKPVRDR